jgi:hypothetical protein
MTCPRRCKFGTTIVLSNKSAIGDGRESQCQQCQKKKQERNGNGSAMRVYLPGGQQWGAGRRDAVVFVSASTLRLWREPCVV